MFRREDIRYGNPWIRLLCCFALACGYWNLYGFAPVTAVENALFGLLLDNDITWAGTAAFPTRLAILYAACVAPAVLRVERPFVMLMCGIGFAALYTVVVLVVLTILELALPLTLPLLGTLSASALLQTMAWSEERSRRRQLERIDAARQQLTDLLVHDLRRRLSSMQASIAMLKRTPPAATERMADLATTLSASTNRMMIQVSALLDVRKIQEGKMTLHRERVRVRDVLDELLTEYRPAIEMVGVSLDATESVGGAPAMDVDRAIFARRRQPPVECAPARAGRQQGPRGSRHGVGRLAGLLGDQRWGPHPGGSAELALRGVRVREARRP